MKKIIIIFLAIVSVAIMTKTVEATVQCSGNTYDDSDPACWTSSTSTSTINCTWVYYGTVYSCADGSGVLCTEGYGHLSLAKLCSAGTCDAHGGKGGVYGYWKANTCGGGIQCSNSTEMVDYTKTTTTTTKTCHYIESYSSWTTCVGGVQTGYNPVLKTVSGGSCSDASFTRACSSCNDWGTCSATCGGGTQGRSCWNNGSYYLDTRSCNTQTCPDCGTAKNTCDIGALEDKVDSGTQYLWNCVNYGSVAPTKATVSCSLAKPACTVANACGIAQGQYFGTKPSGNILCKSSSVPTVYGTGKPSWTWDCTNPDCAGSAGCEAYIHEADCKDISTETNNKPAQDKDSLCIGCTGGLCSVTNPSFDSTGKWNWTCTHDVAGANPDTASCEAPTCLSGDVLNVQAHVYLKEDVNDQRATVNINCTGREVCCEFADTDMYVNGATASRICSGEDGSILVPITTNYPATCYFKDEPSLQVNENPLVTTMCSERACNAQGTCQATPKQASDLSECSSTCSSNADCSSGKIIEVRP